MLLRVNSISLKLPDSWKHLNDELYFLHKNLIIRPWDERTEQSLWCQNYTFWLFKEVKLIFIILWRNPSNNSKFSLRAQVISFWVLYRYSRPFSMLSAVWNKWAALISGSKIYRWYMYHSKYSTVNHEWCDIYVYTARFFNDNIRGFTGRCEYCAMEKIQRSVCAKGATCDFGCRNKRRNGSPLVTRKASISNNSIACALIDGG